MILRIFNNYRLKKFFIYIIFYYYYKAFFKPFNFYSEHFLLFFRRYTLWTKKSDFLQSSVASSKRLGPYKKIHV